MAPTRKTITLKTKLYIIDQIASGKIQVELCDELKLSASTVYKIWKNRNKYTGIRGILSPTIKRIRIPALHDVDEALYKWFEKMSNFNVNMDGYILQTRASIFSKKFHGHDDGINMDWITRFKKRRNISFQKTQGEENSADHEGAKLWITNTWPKLRSEYEEDDIFSADEFALFMNAVPDKTMAKKGKPCKGGKKAKERVSVLACCNMSGTQKMKLLVIGKAQRPRCFPKSVPKDLRGFPVIYKNNSKGWMTSVIWSYWLRRMDKVLKRKILIITDNAPSHVKYPKLNNIKIEFLPPNCTSLIQPMDQGIIANIKVHYNRQLKDKNIESVSKKLDELQELGEEETKIKLPKTDVYQSILMIAEAWKTVTKDTIRNCFNKAFSYGQVHNR